MSNGCAGLLETDAPAGLADAMLDAAAAFFALPDEEKLVVHIRQSPHFRGYSVMHNRRDWREQIHFGAEREPGGAGWRSLEGPNQWPAALGPSWRELVLEYLHQAASAGQRLLRDLGLPVAAHPYLLLKMICYHPQTDSAGTRSGVAPHCDWSWLTLVLQDRTGGLEALDPAGRWRPVLPPPGRLSVHLGEIAEIATDGRLRSEPHRVLNPSRSRARISIPVFLCPPLPDTVAADASPLGAKETHVHRVRNPASHWRSFHFGESEWNRKARGQWCWRRQCLRESTD